MSQMIRTLSSREFGHNVSQAKHLAREGPVFITDRGEPAFVLLNIDLYREMAGTHQQTSLLDLMDSLPDTSEVGAFEIPPLGVELRQD